MVGDNLIDSNKPSLQFRMIILLKVLKNDKRYLSKPASTASKAHCYLVNKI